MGIFDLSHHINQKMPIYPGDKPVILYKDATLTKEGYETYFVSGNLHVGTHLDVPRHIIEDSRFVSYFEIDRFIGRAILLDVRGQLEIDYKEEYEVLINYGDIIVLYTGYDKYYGESVYFDEHPVITKAFVDFMISKKIKLLGMDMPSPDYAPYERHQELLGADICLLENLTNLECLVGIDNIELYAVPLKLDAEASPVRAFARLL
ncbi:cyclase family protein [Vagococcus zengguangii]|uniref:Cyclase family protein n=1 Tax=Vagococcus zengguangii TaxID=2571750 RepID=A0A4D7CV27_9ENTE|nr:cyclase family protein [Vagococcus zengguangii]QCI87283.1 cyclase family protein [Vagococcus zengguangii]TLG80787.1 cyclase family protein [Vagococcus zengguangii]